MTPKIHRIELKTYREEYICPKCKMGYMRYNSISFDTNPPANQHKCSNCSNTFNIFDKCYPLITHEDV